MRFWQGTDKCKTGPLKYQNKNKPVILTYYPKKCSQNIVRHQNLGFSAKFFQKYQ